jgi:putative transposase
MYNRRFQNQRKNIRLENFDYTSTGAYFVTICNQTRDSNWFGQITRDGMQLNAAGEMILETWNELPNRFDIELDTFMVMPDHVHGILVLPDTQIVAKPTEPVGVGLVPTLPKLTPFALTDNDHRDDSVYIVSDRATTRVAPTKNVALGDIVGAFKSLTTNRYIRGVREFDWQPFEKRFWQRDYWERVIRDERELVETRGYVLGNPLRWLESRGLL